jgi:hypothetical protein
MLPHLVSPLKIIARAEPDAYNENAKARKMHIRKQAGALTQKWNTFHLR